MTWRKREIMEMAKQAHHDSKTYIDIYKDEVLAGTVQGYLEAFAKLVDAKATAREREACAKVVDHILKEGGGTWGDAIRARGDKHD
jgi:hypothetical protein